MSRDLTIDNFDLDQFTTIAAQFGSDRFGYVVTPNVDHLIRWHDEPEFRDYYAAASYVLMDSRFLAKLLNRLQGINPGVCPGSDLTARVIERVVEHDDAVVLIGGSEQQAQALREKFGLRNLRHYNPPMNFASQPAEVEACLQFVEASSPFRFCLLAVGCPRQEMLAWELGRRAKARGLALCIGASINFLTGAEQRAPLWMQRLAIEWLYRLLQDPKRLAHRYLVRGPRVFGLLRKTKFILR